MSIYKHRIDELKKVERKRKDALFLYADGLSEDHILYSQKQVEEKRKLGVFGLSESEILSLVKAPKSPTRKFKPEKFKPIEVKQVTEPLKINKSPDNTPGAFTVFQFREWSDEYRIRTRIETSCVNPPVPDGQRRSLSLTMRAARKIADSCDFVSRKKGGYKTFLTLTFTDKQRDRLQREETTIQREISRFCDGLSKMYQRGWDGSMGEPEHNDDFLYVWVAEVPENEAGEPNPHVHMLLNWRVNYALFDRWASRIEKLWGCGFAHLEKIKDTDAAAAYMMKAAGYLCKSQGKSDQGEVRGNRYGMSAAARAPDWETVSETQLHIMGKLIADVSQHMNEKYGHLYNKRRSLNKKIDQYKRGSQVRYAIGKELSKVRENLSHLPVVASKYQIILKGRDAFDRFMSWAKADHSINNDWLPDKCFGEKFVFGARPDTLWYAKFKEVHYLRRARRKIRDICDYEWQSLMDSTPYLPSEYCDNSYDAY